MSVTNTCVQMEHTQTYGDTSVFERKCKFRSLCSHKSVSIIFHIPVCMYTHVMYIVFRFQPATFQHWQPSRSDSKLSMLHSHCPWPNLCAWGEARQHEEQPTWIEGSCRWRTSPGFGVKDVPRGSCDTRMWFSRSAKMGINVLSQCYFPMSYFHEPPPSTAMNIHWSTVNQPWPCWQSPSAWSLVQNVTKTQATEDVHVAAQGRSSCLWKHWEDPGI